jgi:hypothetical protein
MRALALVLAVAVVGLAPERGLAKDTGLIFVSNEKTNNLIVLDPKTYQIVKDIKVSRRPRDMHFSADRSKLYVACGDDDVIDIIDVAKLEVVGKLSTGPSRTFAIDEKRRRIYIANEEGSSLSIIDIDQNIIVHEVPTGAEPRRVHQRGRQDLYVTSEVATSCTWSTPRAATCSRTWWLAPPAPFCRDADGKELWVTAELSGEVTSSIARNSPSRARSSSCRPACARPTYAVGLA